MVTANIFNAFVLRRPARGVIGSGCWIWGALMVLASGGMAADWPTFRGPERTGVAPDKGLLDTWPATGPNLVWETAGRGTRVRQSGDRRAADLHARRRPLHRRRQGRIPLLLRPRHWQAALENQDRPALGRGAGIVAQFAEHAHGRR